MKKLLIIIIFGILSTTQNGFAQKLVATNDAVPPRLTSKVNQIVSGSASAQDKLKKIALWISNQKTLDVKGIKKYRITSYPLKKTLTKKKLLPREYALLFQAMCQQADIPCSLVDGYSKFYRYYDYKKYYTTDYSWNVANLDGTLILVDLPSYSGHLIQRKTFSESLKTLMRKPSFNSKLKFEKSINPAFLNIPPDSAVSLIVPIVPMWQLMEKPLSIEDFEKMNYSNQKNENAQPIAFNELISNYEGKEKKDQHLILAEEGNKYNTKNSLSTGINYFMATKYYYNEQVKNGWESENDKKNKIKSLTDYSNKASTFIDRYINENNNNYKRNLDSLKRKSREINDFIKRVKKESTSTINSLTRYENANSKAIARNEGIIAKKEIEQLNRKNQKVLLTIRKSFSKSTFKDSSSFWKDQFEKNMIQINKEEELFSLLDTSISKFENERMILWDSALHMFNLKLIAIADASDENIKSNNLTTLRKIHQSYNAYTLNQNAFEKNLKQLERQYKTGILKRIDSLNKIITILSNQNKRLLYKIKQCSKPENYASIDSLYEKQSDFVENCHKRSIDNLYRWDLYLKLWNVEYQARKTISNYIAQFGNKYSQTESLCYKKYTKEERLRFKKYNTYGINLKKESIEMGENIKLLAKVKVTKKDPETPKK